MATWDRMRMGGSVVRYLMLLSLLPVIGMSVLAGVSVQRTRDDVASTQGVQRAMARIQTLDELRIALDRESTATITASLTKTLGISTAQLVAYSGLVVDEPVVARQRVDGLLAKLTADPVTRAVATRIGLHWHQLRPSFVQVGKNARFDQIVGIAAASINRYGATADQVGTAEIAATQDLSRGRFGQLNVGLARASAQLSASTLLTVVGTQRASLMFAVLATKGAAHATALTKFGRADATYQELSQVLESALQGRVADAWHRLNASPAAQLFEGMAKRALAEDEDLTSGMNAAVSSLQVGQAVAAVQTGGSRLLELAVQDGTAAARADEDRSRRHAAEIVAATAAVVAFVLLLLTGIGATLRRRLNQVAGAAEQLSAGRFSTVQIRGPREVTFASAGLNDAARSLERVLASAERLAAGDLTAPELSAPGEGPLGAAVYASVEQLTASLRERERLQRELAHQASHDMLTGLPNRAFAQRLLAEAVLSGQRSGLPIAVLFIDLDHFKPINDTHGHAAGDVVLRVVARRMEAQLRSDQVLCRLGGDEFVVVTPGDGQRATELASRLIDAAAEPIHWSGRDLRLGASIGIAVRDGAQSADELLIIADHAVYRAKAQGRGIVRS